MSDDIEEMLKREGYNYIVEFISGEYTVHMVGYPEAPTVDELIALLEELQTDKDFALSKEEIGELQILIGRLI